MNPAASFFHNTIFKWVATALFVAAVVVGFNQLGISALGWANAQLLRMEWLSSGVGWFVQGILGLSLSTPVGASVHFFVYDVIKIFILLSVLIFSISYIQSYFPPERTRLPQ